MREKATYMELSRGRPEVMRHYGNHSDRGNNKFYSLALETSKVLL